jgi:hypothetical protein
MCPNPKPQPPIPSSIHSLIPFSFSRYPHTTAQQFPVTYGSLSTNTPFWYLFHPFLHCSIFYSVAILSVGPLSFQLVCYPLIESAILWKSSILFKKSASFFYRVFFKKVCYPLIESAFLLSSLLFWKSSILFKKSSILFKKSSILFKKSSILFKKSASFLSSLLVF